MKKKLDLQIKEVALDSRNVFDVAGSDAPCGGPCSGPCCDCDNDCPPGNRCNSTGDCGPNFPEPYGLYFKISYDGPATSHGNEK